MKSNTLVDKVVLSEIRATQYTQSTTLSTKVFDFTWALGDWP